MARAAYARPVEAAALASAPMPCEQGLMTPGAGMDPDQPALCAELCQRDAAQPVPDLTLSSAAVAPALALLFVLVPVGRVPSVAPCPPIGQPRSVR